MKKSYKQKLQETFTYRFNGYRERGSTVEFNIEDGITFEELMKISKILKTMKIDWNFRKYAGCPTCGGYDYYSITCRDVPGEKPYPLD